MAGLLGRDEEAARIDAALAALARGESPLVAVVGDGGIGKTRLLDELAERAARTGAVVLRGRALEVERGTPYAVLREALEDTAATLRGLRDHDAAVLAGVLPETDPGAEPVTAERHEVHAAVRALLRALAARRPLVLALDDLHWADAETLELLAVLLGRRWRWRMLLAVALRPTGGAATLRRALDRAAVRGDAVLELAPLSDAAAAALLPAGLSEQARDEIVRAAAGNPFFVLELARAAERDAVPPPVAAALQEELDACSAAARQVALGAAVAGEVFDLPLALAAAGVERAGDGSAVDELVAAGLVRPGGAPGTFAFRHSLVWRAVLDAAPPAWSVGAHARAAAALAARGAPASSQAVHLEFCAEPGDEAAVGTLAAAGAEVSATAPGIAARWFAAALALRPPSDPRRLELLVPLASSLAAAGDLAGCRTALEGVLELLPPTSGVLRVHAVCTLARVEHALGRRQAARRLLDDGMADAAPGSTERAMLELGFASNALQSADFTAMLAHADAARSAAHGAGDDVLAATAAAKQALAAYHVADCRTAVLRADEAAAMLDRLPRDRLLQRPDALAWLAWSEYFLERLGAAEHWAERGLALAHGAGHGSALVPLLIARAAIRLERGDIQRGLPDAEAAFDAAALQHQHQPALWATAVLVQAQALAGEPGLAVRTGTDGLRDAADVGPGTLALIHARLAEAHLAAGDPAMAARTLLDGCGGPELALLERSWRPAWYELLVHSALERDDRTAAQEWLARAEAADHGLGLDGRSAAVLRARSALARADGDTTAAAEAAERAAGLAAGVGTPVAAGRGHRLAGLAHAAAGRREAALAHLYAAERLFAGASAVRDRDAVRRDLRALGRRGPNRRQARPAAPLGLTAREAQIAELVAAGKRNREIAADLFLSESTVESHLRKAFLKLGVSSRAALAARLVASGDSGGA